MKTIKALTAVLLLSFAIAGQQSSPKAHNFDIADFNKKFDAVRWLVEYDYVAWVTSDVVMKEDREELAKLGAEWFCFKDSEGTWHAVYGKLENEKYDTVFHYKMTAKSKISRTKETIKPDFLNAHARSLDTARKRVNETFKGKKAPSFNQYIRQNDDESFDVWFLPAFQRNGMAVYGAEFIFRIDRRGEKILKETSHIQKNFRGFMAKPPREIWLDFEDTEKPTLGAIFFVWYYKSYFTKIFLETSKSVSSLVKDKEKGYFWVHVEKKDKPEKNN